MKKLSFLFLMFSFISCQTKEVREYWNNGELKAIGIEKDGKRIGKWVKFTSDMDTMEIQYYENGTLVMLDEFTHIGDSATKATLTTRSRFLNTKLNGTHQIFYPNRQIEREGHYSNGIRIDTFFYYRLDRTIEQFSVFQNDQIVTQYQYWPNGNIFLKTDNFLHGKHYFYDSLGLVEYVINIDSLESGIQMDTLEINLR